MTSLRWLTAGESHGPMLVATLEGVPAGLPLSEETIAVDLRRRQQGHGRGGRMKIEADRARLVSGVRHGATIGGPVAMLIENRDHANWQKEMKVGADEPGVLRQAQDERSESAVTRPRPGHADLAGGLKYERDDLRDVLERASARETAARVALGAVAKELLRAVDVTVGSAVLAIRDVRARPTLECVPEAAFDASRLSDAADRSEVRAADPDASGRMVAAIDAAQERRDTVGGVFEVRVTGVPPGAGSYVQWDRRLDARLLMAVGSIQGIKAAEVGDGWESAGLYGTQVHDPIVRCGPALTRPTNHAGGTEGGVSNGEALVVRAAMKPIATVPDALPSVDLASGLPARAQVERSDTCAVPAAAVVAEAMVALCVAEALLSTWGADTVAAWRSQVRAAWRRARRLPPHLYLCGLSGCGKTTVGRLVAQAIALPFVDLDEEIEKAAGRPVRDIFRLEGEASFRTREVAVLRTVAAGGRSVIALGGGTVALPEARDIVRRSGDSFWLQAPVEMLAARLPDDGSRPLLASGDPAHPERSRRTLSDLEGLRGETLRMVSDAVIDATCSPEQAAQRLMGAWRALR